MKKNISAAFALFLAAASAWSIDQSKAVTIPQFRNTTNKGDYAWLGVALADMVGNDIASLKKLPVVTREQLGAVLAEQQLQVSSIVDERTAAKAGSIVGAGYIVMGDFIVPSPSAIRINVNVVDVETGKSAGAASITGDPAEVFTLEKLLVAKTLDSLGVSLSETEKVRLFQIPTTSVSALEQNFRGVIALEKNDKGSAKTYFESAVKADPYYREAKTNLDKASVVFSGGGLFANAQAELGEKDAQIAAVREFRDWFLRNALEFKIVGSPRIASTNPEKKTADIAIDWKADFNPAAVQRLIDFYTKGVAGWKGDQSAKLAVLPPKKRVAEEYNYAWYREAAGQWHTRPVFYIVSFSLLMNDGSEYAVSVNAVAILDGTLYGNSSSLKYLDDYRGKLNYYGSYEGEKPLPVVFAAVPQNLLEQLKEIRVRSVEAKYRIGAAGGEQSIAF